MTALFYALLTTPKVKRWLMMLDRLEEQAQTGKELAQYVGCTKRTVVSDVKEIKGVFQDTFVFLGEENGYLVGLQEPRTYYQRKQALLAQEPLFYMVDALLENQERTNHEWAQQLGVPSATFTRLKRQLNRLLQDQYGLNLCSTTNQLCGAETRIRQFFFDFYFTLPLYPKDLTDRLRQIRTYEGVLPSSNWQVNHRQLVGWLVLAIKRRAQGCPLPKQADSRGQRLANALDPLGQVPLPDQEKAAIFLAALEERQFLRPLCQTEFLYAFSSARWAELLVLKEEEKQVRLFQTLIQLMRVFLHLPEEGQRSRGEKETSQGAEESLFTQMMAVFLKEKQRLATAVSVGYRLIGSQALQQWIKKESRAQLEAVGYSVYEGEPLIDGRALPRIQVTNQPTGKERQLGIVLSGIPSQAEIAQRVRSYAKQRNEPKNGGTDE